MAEISYECKIIAWLVKLDHDKEMVKYPAERRPAAQQQQEGRKERRLILPFLPPLPASILFFISLDPLPLLC